MSKKKNNKKANKGNQKVNNQKLNQKNEEVKVNINDKEAENILNKIAKDEVKEEKKVEAKKENKPEVKEEKKVENKKEAEEKLNEVNKSLQKSKKSNKNSTGWLINKNEDLKISDKIMKISSSMWNLQLMMMHKKYEFELKHKRTKKDVIKVRIRNNEIDLKVKFKEEQDITYKTVEIKNENGKETEVKYNKDYLELDDNIIPLDVILMPVFDFYFENKKLKAEYVKYTEGNIKVQNDKITLDLNVRKEGYPIEVKDLSLDSLNELVKEDKDNILGASVEYFRRNIIVEEPEPEDETAGINKFERAFKFPPESKKSILKSVEFSVGNLGNITPIAKIEPVKLRDNTIKSISLGSVERFKMLGLSVGDEVIIKYEINNNKIIPYLDIDDTCEISGEHLIEAPTHCPFCGSELVEDPLLRCNNESCSSRVIGKILNYVNKMRIANLDIGTITTLFNHKILNCIEDLYKLKDRKTDIISLDGFGKKSFNSIIDGIDNRRKVYDYELFGSIGIPSIGERMFKKVFSVIPSEDIIELVKNPNEDIVLDLNKRMMKINGFGEKTVMATLNGVLSNKELIKFLLKEIRIEKNLKTYNKKVCFSKIRDNEFEKYLDANNVLVLDSLKKDCDILIVPSLEESSSKIDKARKKGILIITIDEAYKYFGYGE